MSKTVILNETPYAALLLDTDDTGKITTRLVNMNSYNYLKFKIKGVFEDIDGKVHTKVCLGEDYVISPTTQEYVFCIETNGKVVHTTPDLDKKFMAAVVKAHFNKDLGLLAELFNTLYTNRLREQFFDWFFGLLGTRVSRSFLDSQRGVFVDNEFFVAENLSVYRKQPPKFSEEGEIVSNGRWGFICIVPKVSDVEPISIRIGSDDLKLTSFEQLFLGKVMCIIGRRKLKKGDDLYSKLGERVGEDDGR